MNQNKRQSRKHFALVMALFLSAQVVAFLMGTAMALKLGVVPVRAFGIGAVCWGVITLVGVFLLMRRNS